MDIVTYRAEIARGNFGPVLSLSARPAVRPAGPETLRRAVPGPGVAAALGAQVLHALRGLEVGGFGPGPDAIDRKSGPVKKLTGPGTL